MIGSCSALRPWLRLCWLLAADHATRDVAFDVIDQFDDLLLAGTCFIQFAADDVVAEQPAGGFCGKYVEVLDHLVQATVQFRLAASAVGVPQRVVHGIGRNVMAHHQRYGLLQELGRLAGFLRIQFDDAGRFAGLTHGLGNSMANGQSIDQSGVSCLMKRPG